MSKHNSHTCVIDISDRCMLWCLGQCTYLAWGGGGGGAAVCLFVYAHTCVQTIQVPANPPPLPQVTNTSHQ